MYAHLLDGVAHTEKCQRIGGAQVCGPDCSWAEFHAWLDEPLLRSEHAARDRARDRLELLKQGEVPA